LLIITQTSYIIFHDIINQGSYPRGKQGRKNHSWGSTRSAQARQHRLVLRLNFKRSTKLISSK